MNKNRTWSRLGFAISMLVVIIAFAGWLVIGNYERWLPGHRQAELRPSTIKMVVLRIDSNIMRIQSTMETLVYAEYPKALADKVETVNQLAADIDDDFKAMGGHFSSGNAQYQKALSLFNAWKPVRDEVIRLTAAGPSPRAKEIVRGECETHARQIREALKALDRFSEKRADDFDETVTNASRKKPRTY